MSGCAYLKIRLAGKLSLMMVFIALVVYTKAVNVLFFECANAAPEGRRARTEGPQKRVPPVPQVPLGGHRPAARGCLMVSAGRGCSVPHPRGVTRPGIVTLVHPKSWEDPHRAHQSPAARSWGFGDVTNPT